MTDFLSNIHVFPFYSDLLLPWHYSIYIYICENSGMPYEVMAHYHKFAFAYTDLSEIILFCWVWNYDSCLSVCLSLTVPPNYGCISSFGVWHLLPERDNCLEGERWTILAAGDIDHVKKSRIQKGRRSVLWFTSGQLSEFSHSAE